MKKIIKIKKTFEPEEPMNCERRGCEEELNGLMHYHLNFGAGYVLDIWLCQKCAKEFEKLKDRFIIYRD